MQANTNAINDTVTTHDRHVHCDGKEGPLGHPRVFLHIKEREITCPYCSRQFVLVGDGHGHH